MKKIRPCRAKSPCVCKVSHRCVLLINIAIASAPPPPRIAKKAFAAEIEYRRQRGVGKSHRRAWRHRLHVASGGIGNRSTNGPGKAAGICGSGVVFEAAGQAAARHKSNSIARIDIAVKRAVLGIISKIAISIDKQPRRNRARPGNRRSGGNTISRAPRIKATWRRIYTCGKAYPSAGGKRRRRGVRNGIMAASYGMRMQLINSQRRKYIA